MADKLERFTERAQRALKLAQEEARRLNHHEIDAVHLLLGLVREENGIVVKTLRELGVEPGQVIRTAERATGHGDGPPVHNPALSPHAKRVIELAVDEARLMGHHYIGSEHLLLGLVRHGEGAAVHVLRALGVNLDNVRTQIAHAILRAQAQSKQTQAPRLIDSFTYDLTTAAEQGKLDPVIGRQNEIERLIQVLSRRTKNNPVLVGEPGVGKRAIVNGLAQRISEGRVPAALLKRRLLILEIGNLTTDTATGKLFELRRNRIINELTESGSILFLDQVHRLIDAASNSVDAADILKLALSQGKLQIIGATTPNQYQRVRRQ